MKRFKNQRFIFILVSLLGSAMVLALACFCLFQIPHLNTTYSVDQFSPKNHPAHQAELAVQHSFELKSIPAFYAILELPPATKGTWLEPARMATLKEVTTDVESWPEVASALSLSRVDISQTKGNELHVGPLAETVDPSQWTSTVDHQPLLQPQLISKDHRSVLLMVNPKGFDLKALTVLEGKLQTKLTSLGQSFRTGIAGVPVIQIRFSDLLQKEIVRFFLLSMLAFIAMFYVFYSNLTPVAFVALGLLACNICAIGFIVTAGVPFTILLATLPIVISIAFVSMAIHTLHLWAERLTEESDGLDAAQRWFLSLRTLQEIFKANLLGSLTTSIGFATLAFCAIPAIRTYAWAVASAVMVTFLLAQVVFALTLVWVQPVLRTWTQGRAHWMLALTRRAKPIFYGFLLLTGTMGLAADHLNFSSRLFDDLPKSTPVYEAMGQIDHKFGGTVDLNVTVDLKTPQAWTDPIQLAKLDSSLKKVRQIQGVGSALAVSDFLGSPLPSTKGAVAEQLFMFSMSPDNPLRHFISGDENNVRVAVRLADLTSDDIDTLRAKIHQTMQEQFPSAHVEETGLAIATHQINREVAHELVTGFWQSIAVIGLLLVIIFRSWRYALMACLPNFMAPIILIGIMAIARTPVKPATALVFSIAIGLAFNNTVYLLSKLKRAQKEVGSRTLALRLALLSEGKPCLSESLLTFVGFLVFLSSEFSINQTFGVYMAVSILAGGVGDLAFLPSVLKLFPNLWSKADKVAHGVASGVASVAKSKSIAPKVAAAIFGLIIILIEAGPAHAAVNDADALLAKARQSIETNSDQADVSLKIIEANGDSKIRKMNMKSMHDKDGFHALVRITEPADVKGTALLADVKNGEESQWLFLPSSGQVRRVVSGKKSVGVLGSELSPDDLNADILKGASAKVVKQDAKMASIEVTPTPGKSEYTRVVMELSMPQALPQTSTYYIGDKAVKKVEFKDYTASNKIYRAKEIMVQNLANGRSTAVDLSDVKINPKLDADDFTVSALKRR